jgi:hypothetical protein
VYFAPEVRTAFDGAGLKGFWMGYFAGRAAPMGPVPAEVVTATFFNFQPAMVARAIPDAWNRAAPAAVLEARLEGVGAALRPLTAGADLVSACALAREAAESVDTVGRPLAAANAALPWPGDPLLDLWQAITVLREFRGDTHVAALVSEGVGGCEAHVLMAASGAVPALRLREARGWSEDEWAAAERRLRGQGWIDDHDRLTDAGRAVRERVEQRTDERALPPWLRLGADGCERLAASLQPMLVALATADLIPYPNPMGLPRPA